MANSSTVTTPFPDPKSELGIAIRIELERLAAIRTAYSSERSLKSWMRTAVSLYTFGFAVAKFFDYVAVQQDVASAGPRWLGFVLVATGIISLLLAVAQYLERLTTMSEVGLTHLSHYWLPPAGALALIAIGCATAIGISLS